MAGNVIKGLVVEIGGDTTKLGKALEGIDKKTRSLSGELSQINKLLKFDPGNADLLAQKQQVLAAAIKETADRLATLREAEKDVQEQFKAGEVSSEQVRALQREIVATEQKMARYQQAADETAGALEAVGQSSEEAGEGIDDAGKEAAKAAKEHEKHGEAAEESGGKLEKLGNIAKAAGKALATATAAAAAGAVALGKVVLESYADYEQLVGGVETLFGESARKLETYADNAYKTAGLSANAYMETVTGFSASLIQSLGGDTEAAVKYADMAITDMSDNANKMGTDMSSIQNAYQGFAKQNYTMLDNLKLGYGGTKEEMERLLSDAEQLAGVEFSIDSYADVVQAIHVVQESMGVAGTTALEAEKTISGSMNAAGAAVQNLVTGLGTAGADVGQLSQDVVDAARNLLFNVLPVIENITAAAPAAVSVFADAVREFLPTLASVVNGLLPEILSLAGVILETLGGALIDSLPVLAQTAVRVVGELGSAFLSAMPQLASVFPQLASVFADDLIPQVVAMIQSGLPQFIDGLVLLASEILNAVPQILPPLIAAVPVLIQSVVDALTNGENAQMLLNGALSCFMAIVDAIPALLSELLPVLPSIITTICQFLAENTPLILDAAVSALGAILEAIPQIAVLIVENFPQIAGAVLEGLGSILISTGEWFGELFSEVGAWIGDLISQAGEAGQGFLDAFVEWIRQLPDKIAYWLGYAIGSCAKFIIEFPGKAKTAAQNFLQNVVSFLTQLPGKVLSFLTSALNHVISWATSFPAKAKTAATNAFNSIVNTLTSLPTRIKTIGTDLIQGLWNGINDKISWVKKKISGFADQILGGIKDAFGIHSPSKEMAWVGEMLDAGLAEGLEANADAPVRAIESVSDDLLGAVSGVNGLQLERGLRTAGALASPAATADSLGERLDRILHAIEAGQVLTIDGGALVGATAEMYDRRLGSMRQLAAKGAL